MGHPGPCDPQIFPHITELFVIQEETELFLVTCSPIHILISGFVCVGGGVLSPVFGGLGVGHLDNCELPSCHTHY